MVKQLARKAYITSVISILGVMLAVALTGSAIAGPFEGLQAAYHATFANGSLESGLDPLGLGPLKAGNSLDAGNNATWTPQAGTILLGVTRPTNLVGGVASSGLFATPVDFGTGSVMGMRATFVAPVGPHNTGNGWAVVLAARTGDENDLFPETRVAASLNVRASGARLNVVGASVPSNLPNMPQQFYDAIFDPVDPQPFTLELLIDRASGIGTASLKVGDMELSHSFQSAFKADTGPVITAVGPSIAIANGAGLSASVRVRDFQIFTVKRQPKDTDDDLCPAEFGCRSWPVKP